MLSRVTSKKALHKSPTAPPTASFPVPSTPPTDPVPPSPSSRPSDVLIARLHELKRLSKSLCAHFTALSAAHTAYGKSLADLAAFEGEGALRSSWLSGSLFIPPNGVPNGEGGWAEFCGKVNEGTAKEAEAHLHLAKLAESEVIDPLKRLRVGIKAFIADLDSQSSPLAAEVLKEREASVAALTHLATSVASYTSTPLQVQAMEDPLIVRSVAEGQMREQVSKENELLRLVVHWQEKTREFEMDVLEKCKACWRCAKVQLDSRQELVKLTHRVDAIAPDAEWNHFSRLNHLIPPTTPTRSLDLIEYPERDHPATKPIKEGLLERKKRFSKIWKEAFFVLTPAGYLHEYRSSSTPLNQPHLSLFLPACTVHPLTSPSSSKRSGGGAERPAEFVIEGKKAPSGGTGGTLKGSLGMGSREKGRVYRARSTPEAQGWWSEIEKLSKASFTTHPVSERQGPAPTAVQHAGLPLPAAVVEHGEQSADEGEAGDGSPETTEVSASVAAAAAVEEAGKTEEVKEREKERKEGTVTALENQARVMEKENEEAKVERPVQHEERQSSYPVMPGGLIRNDTEPTITQQGQQEAEGRKAPAPTAVAVLAPAVPTHAQPQPFPQPLPVPGAQSFPPQALPPLQPVPIPAPAPAGAQPLQPVPATTFVAPTAVHPQVPTTSDGALTYSPLTMHPPPLPPRQPVVDAGGMEPGPSTVEPARGIMVDSEASKGTKKTGVGPAFKDGVKQGEREFREGVREGDRAFDEGKKEGERAVEEKKEKKGKEHRKSRSWFGFGSGGGKK
ncbi:hypothetical protein JCM8547_004175 [Rhodosporidiobolus lusitaniae]